MTEFWHKEAPQNIAVMLKTDLSSGLSETEAHHRLNEFGLNVLTKQKNHPQLQFSSCNLIALLFGCYRAIFALQQMAAPTATVDEFFKKLIGKRASHAF